MSVVIYSFNYDILKGYIEYKRVVHPYLMFWCTCFNYSGTLLASFKPNLPKSLISLLEIQEFLHIFRWIGF